MVILHSKFQTPKRYHTLHQKRLVGRFEDINQYKLIAVTAGAGYGKTTLVTDAIEFILDRLPGHIHLVIIGRKDLSLRLSSLRAKEQFIEIGENDLSFTTSEIKRFFSGTLLQTDTYIKGVGRFQNTAYIPIVPGLIT